VEKISSEKQKKYKTAMGIIVDKLMLDSDYDLESAAVWLECFNYLRALDVIEVDFFDYFINNMPKRLS
jgi:hypothetical protein